MTEAYVQISLVTDALKNISDLAAEYDDLSEPEQFCVVLSEVKRLTPRLNSILFKMKFDEIVSDVKPVCLINGNMNNSVFLDKEYY